MESELVALASLVRDLKWIDFLLQDLYGENVQHAEINFTPRQVSARETISVRSDSEAAIAHAKRPFPSARSKHLELRHCYIKEAIDRKLIDLSFVSGRENLADVFTKPATLARLNFLHNN